jgi:hypothetical protein
MTKDELEKLIEDKPPEVRAKAVLLFNGYARAMAAYQAESSTSNLRTWKSAEEALTEYAASIGYGETKEELNNISVVLAYLVNSGWKCTKTSLYRHQQQGKIKPDADGKYSKRIVDKYARTFLKQTATGKRVVEETDDLQRKKLIKENARLDLTIEREQFNLDKDRGLYVPREQMEIELATRAGILVAGLKHWVQSKAADWIAAVGGDNKRVGELINIMNRDVDEHINIYASAKEYEVIIGASEDQWDETVKQIASKPESEENVIPAEAGIQEN